MIKAIVLVARQDGISPEEFAHHYREQHLRLLAKLPSVRRLVINHVLTDPNAPPPPYDIVAEDWFDNLAAMAAAFETPEGQAVFADAASFLDLARLQIMVVKEEEIPFSTGTAAAPVG